MEVVNFVTGGPHAGNKLAFQEYFIVPVSAETSYLTGLSVTASGSALVASWANKTAPTFRSDIT